MAFFRPMLGVCVGVTVTWVGPRTIGVDGEARQPGGYCWRRRLLCLRVQSDCTGRPFRLQRHASASPREYDGLRRRPDMSLQTF